MNKSIDIEKAQLLNILDYMKTNKIIPITYQYTGAEEFAINGVKKIRLNFAEWSYPFVMGREAARMLPDQMRL